MLMQPLKLFDGDVNHFLINGISSLAIRGLAVLLRINFFDDFLREMQHITATCSVQSKKISATLPRKNNKKNSNSSPQESDQRRNHFTVLIVMEPHQGRLFQAQKEKGYSYSNRSEDFSLVYLYGGRFDGH